MGGVLFVPIEFRLRQFNRYEKNTIHLSGLTEIPSATKNKTTLPLYSKVKYGTNVNKRKLNVSFVDTSFVNYIDLKKTKKNFIMITANKNEYMNKFKDVFIFDTCMSRIQNSNTKITKYQSGIVVLMIAAVPRVKRDTSQLIVFDDCLYTEVKKCKPDIKKSFDHFCSTGEVYAFGNKADYKVVNNSSVGEFRMKTSKVM